MQTINRKSLKQLLDTNQDALVINVLPEEKYEKQHIPGSINIPVKDNDSFAQEVEAKATSKDQRIIVYCANTECPLSGQALRKLENAGFSDVADYEEGTKGWFEQDNASQAA